MWQISTWSITHFRTRCLARVSVEACWTDWMSSSTVLCTRLVPGSTCCFVSTLNSFRLRSWLPSWHKTPRWKREKWIGVCLPLRYILQPPPLPTFSSPLLPPPPLSPAIRCPLKQLSRWGGFTWWGSNALVQFHFGVKLGWTCQSWYYQTN